MECLLDKIGLLEYDILEKRHKKEKRNHLRNKMRQNMSKEVGRMERVIINMAESSASRKSDESNLDGKMEGEKSCV